MKPKIITQPIAEPLTLDQCRAHLEVQPYEIDSDGAEVHPDDALILSLLASAREYCENFLGISIAAKVYEVALDEFPAGAIELPMPPLVEVLSITVGESSSDGLVEESAYVVDTFSEPGRVVPVTSWPSAAAATNNIRIRYVAGYEVTSDSIGGELPAAILGAVRLMLGHLYANREAVTVGGTPVDLPLGVEALLRPLRVRFGWA